MPKYRVNFVVDATMSVEVEADNGEEAEAKAEDIVSAPGLCYHCSRDLDLGDVQEVVSVYEIE